MSDDKSGRELTPQEPIDDTSSDSAVTPASEGDSRSVERFQSGPATHTVGLTEERTAQIVRQSGNARNVVFLALLVIAIFIPVYWFYESGIPAAGAEGRLSSELETQYVADVARGYELYLANCARCHGDQGQGGIGPPLNSQPKLYNALTPTLESGTGHLNPDYIDKVLSVGGRYVCGDADSLMDAWLAPNGPLNYRQVEELIAWMTASSEIVFERHVESHGEGDEESAGPDVVQGWRDPSWEPEPGATPPPACWRNPSGQIGGGPAPATPSPDPNATAIPIDGGSTDAPRTVEIEATAALQFLGSDGERLTQIDAVEGETIEFVVNNSAGFDHNFYLGPPDALQVPGGTTPVGIETWPNGVMTTTWTVEVGPDGLQFGCTVSGHYSLMHGDVVIQS